MCCYHQQLKAHAPVLVDKQLMHCWAQRLQTALLTCQLLLLLPLLQGKYARERGLAQGLAAAPDLAGYAYHGKR
jgi:hypothetical protein